MDISYISALENADSMLSCDCSSIHEEEILKHVKAIRYKTDDAYKYKVDCEKEKIKEAKENKLYFSTIVMSDNWYRWAKEYVSLKFKYKNIKTASLTDYLAYRSYGMEFMDIAVVEFPLSNLKEYCLYKYERNE